LGADLDGLQTEIRECADVYVVHLRMTAEFLVGLDEVAAILLRELASGRFVDVRAGRHFKANVLVSLRMLMGDCACPDESDSQLELLVGFITRS
jgi:hypothetical protein